MQNPVYCAVDTADIAHGVKLCRVITPYVGGIKLGMEFFYGCGVEGFKAISGETGLPIFLDLKLHDIPNTVAQGLRALLPLKPSIMNVHCQGGLAMLRAATNAVSGSSTQLIGVTALTSLDADDLAAIGSAQQPEALVATLAGLAHSAGLAGVVCSPHELGTVRAQWPDALCVVPGIRLDSDANADQKRVMTPKQAMAAGASILVIGRPITAASDPAKAAAAIAESLQ